MPLFLEKEGEAFIRAWVFVGINMVFLINAILVFCRCLSGTGKGYVEEAFMS